MGYFSNGTESMDYQNRYCARCVHDGECAVWLAHLLRNYEECNNPNSILHLLIPQTKDGQNEKCKMFHAGKAPFFDGEKAGLPLEKTIHPAQREWAIQKGLL